MGLQARVFSRNPADSVQILIAEDDRTSRAVLEKTLIRLGYWVHSAQDGREGWNLFERHRPPVVITDWMMPDLDGLALCRRIREHGRDDRYTFVIVLTALGGKQNYLDAMNAGADEFLTKPFDPDELVARLRVAERILSMQATIGSLEVLHGCCESCRRIRTADGRWAYLRPSMAAESVIVRCPECSAQEPVDARPVAAGAPNLE